jgi:nitroreductase
LIIDVVLFFSLHTPLGLCVLGPDGAAITTTLTAAICAPDHGKLKPWRFIIIRGAARHAFGAVLAEALRKREPGASEALLAREKAKALRAPVILVVIAEVRERRLVPAIEQIIAAGIAAHNILLVAHGLGYGWMWRTGAAAYDAHVRQALGIDAPDSIVAFLYLGTPETVPSPRDIAALQPEVRDWDGVNKDATPATK